METYESQPTEITREWKDQLFQHKLACGPKNWSTYKCIIGGTLLVYSSFMVVGNKRSYFITQVIRPKI